MSLWTIVIAWFDPDNADEPIFEELDVASESVDEAQVLATSILCSMHRADIGAFPTGRTYSVQSAKEKTMEDDYSPYTRPSPPSSPAADGYSPYTGSTGLCPNCERTFHTDSYDPYAGDYEPETEDEWTDEWLGDDELAWEDLPTEYFSYADGVTTTVEPARATITSLSGMVISKLTALANGYVPYIKAHFFV